MAQSSQLLRQLAAKDARKYGVNPNVFLRQIQKESGFNPNAQSPAGAIGIAQFMPGTAASYHIDPRDPVQALDAAARYDANELKAFGGDYRKALAAYNGGAGNADKWNDPSFAGGRIYRYVRDILGGTNQPSSGPTPDSQGGSPSLVQALTPRAAVQQPQVNYQPMLLQALTGGGQDNYQQFYGTLAKALQQRNQPALTPQQPPAPAPRGSPPVAVPTGGGKAGGFLQNTASYRPGRIDQGHDFQTDPGAAIVAPGDGKVVAVKSDPHGFGPAYPIVHFTSGPYAGKDIYIGHTLATLRPGQTFRAGQTISRTGTAPVGNASVPGWAEIGFSTGQLPTGQRPPF